MRSTLIAKRYNHRQMGLTNRKINIISGLLIAAVTTLGILFFFSNHVSLNLSGTPTSTISAILANPPAVSSSADQAGPYVGALLQTAQATDRLEISAGCKTTPQAAKTSQNNLLTIYNGDSITHQIKFNGGVIELNAGESKKLTEEIIERPGTYTYTCDGEKINGIIIAS